MNFPNPYIIAEIGSNWKLTSSHNEECDFQNALNCIDLVADSGASAAKFQLFTHMELYGKLGDDTYSLPDRWIPELKKRCDKNNIDFLCTAFSDEGFQAVDPYVKAHKIASSSVSNDDLTDAIVGSMKPFFYSSGMVIANFPNIDRAIPFWCASKYPAAFLDYDVNFFAQIRDKKSGWGLSDHTLDDTLALFCRANGAQFFEKHVNPGASLSPDMYTSVPLTVFSNYVTKIKDVSQDHAIQVKREAYDMWADKWDDERERFVRKNAR